MMPRTVTAYDSHTAGEPTRVVTDGGPDLGGGTSAERLEVFRTRFDSFRSAVVNEPRGSDVLVGALLHEPHDPTCAVGVIFFNNVGFLGMCGHGTIGVAATLAHLGRLQPGRHRFETPVGPVAVELFPDGRTALTNVPSRRVAAGVTLEVPGVGRVIGDVAWGGNWFFLADLAQPAFAGDTPRAVGSQTLWPDTFAPRTSPAARASADPGESGLSSPHSAAAEVTAERRTSAAAASQTFSAVAVAEPASAGFAGSSSVVAERSRHAATRPEGAEASSPTLAEAAVADHDPAEEDAPAEPLELTLAQVPRLTDLAVRIRRAANRGGFPEVDHVELFGPPRTAGGDARNFVLCPGRAYDRSPCGTGTSAKLACLAASGKLPPGREWVQESILGTRFAGSYVWADAPGGAILPTLIGTAYLTAEIRLLFDPRDPFAAGIRPGP